LDHYKTDSDEYLVLAVLHPNHILLAAHEFISCFIKMGMGIKPHTVDRTTINCCSRLLQQRQSFAFRESPPN